MKITSFLKSRLAITNRVLWGLKMILNLRATLVIKNISEYLK